MNTPAILLSSVILGFIVEYGMVQGAPPNLTSFDTEVNALLSKMSDEDKVGQMTQVTIDVILKDASKPWDEIEIDTEKLRIAIHEYKVGSILNVAGTGSYTGEQWHKIITAIQDSAANTNLKIPILYGIDSIHGASYIRNSILTPQAIGLAATFNLTLARDLARVSALQTRAAGIPWNFYPQVDIGRQKLWPRLWETFGEDVKLVKDMGRAYTEGLQGDDLKSQKTVAACLKHYVGYGLPITGRDRTPAWIDERMMHEYFLPPFEESVRAGAVSVMINSGEVNGIPGHANFHLITEILKNKYNFEGFAVSDWEDIIRLHTRDHTADTPQEAVRQAIMAGVDMSMVPFDFNFYNYTLQGVRDGTIPRSRIDDAVRRILRVKYALGLFDGRNAWPNASALNSFNDSAFDQSNLDAAHQVITLLKNQGNVLPIKLDQVTQTSRILVTGPTADSLSVLNGGWSYTWQGSNEAIYPGHYRNKTIVRSLMDALPPNSLDFIPTPSFDQPQDLNQIVNAASYASYIVVCLGEKSYTETPGNINQLTLEDSQLNLVERLHQQTGRPIITILVEGRPRIIHRIVNISSAIIMMYLPGMEGGRALADVLLGKYNPSGRLSITYPRYEHRLTNYDYKWNEIGFDNSVEVEFEFGHGLSYTTFNYANMVVPTTVEWDDPITISVDVTNTGSHSGDHTVLLYISDLYRTVTPPIKELKAYNKSFFEVNQMRKIQFTLTIADLSFIGINMQRQTEPGLFKASIGDLVHNFTLKAKSGAITSTNPSTATSLPSTSPSTATSLSSVSQSIFIFQILIIAYFKFF